MGERGKPIRASEVGEYVFCARAWRLRVDGVKPTSGGEAREAGTRWHRSHGRTVRRAKRLRALASLLFFLALALAAFALLLRVWR
ncbi:MAG TPA: hypothetical protein VD968_00940 [Pyrinomonadaceae bacterium]|nr:hypothetical protein [Pyrinomonadaceae bacterium]